MKRRQHCQIPTFWCDLPLPLLLLRLTCFMPQSHWHSLSQALRCLLHPCEKLVWCVQPHLLPLPGLVVQPLLFAGLAFETHLVLTLHLEEHMWAMTKKKDPYE